MLHPPPTLSTETQELIPALCRQFAQATGWPLSFTAVEPDEEDVELQLQNDPACCWTAEVGDGTGRAGILHLSTPDEGVPRSSYAEATNLAAVLVQLLAKLATASRRIEARNNDVSTFVNLGLAVPAQENLPWSLTQLLKAAVQLTGSRCAAFFLLDSTTSRLKLRAVHQISADQVPLANRQLASSMDDLAALAGGGPVTAVAHHDGSHPALPLAIHSAACVAVQSETMPIGTLWVYDRRTRDFSERDQSVLQSIAAHVAAVLERVALLRNSETQDRITRELRAASESQPGHGTDDLPHDPRFEVAARCASCYELGGDLCEAFAIDQDQIALAIGDASGNSIPAAMIMSAVRGAVRTHPADTRQVTRIMEGLNLALYRITRSHQFMSLCYGVFDAAQRRFTYANAGHPSPLLFRNGQVTPLDSHGLLLGVIREVAYTTSVLELLPGDLLVLYSDGISEARNSAQEMFRTEGIVSAVLASRRGTAADILHTVWTHVDAHIAGHPADDRTLLVLRVR